MLIATVSLFVGVSTEASQEIRPLAEHLALSARHGMAPTPAAANMMAP
jgi:hypothetical protein